MSDEYTPTTETVARSYVQMSTSGMPILSRTADEERHLARRRFDRWHAKDRADTVMAFANHFLKHEDWKKARQFANDILEGKA